MGNARKTAGLIGLACLALGLRLGAVFFLSAEHAGPVAYEHGRIAENLLAGRGFSITFLGGEGPTSQQAPFYPGLLTAAYALFGVGTPAAHLAVQLLQCAVGSGLVLAVVWLTWSLLPRRPELGWVAGLAAAVYPTHVYAVTHLQVALWAALFLTLLLAVVVSPEWRTRRGGALLAGCLAGAILLIEPILALALPICAVVFWLGQPSRWNRTALARVAVMAGVAGVVVAPWLIRNRLVHGEFVFIKSSFGYAFWQGNNSRSWGTDKIPKPTAEAMRLDHDGSLAGMDKALWESRHETLYIDDVLLAPDDYKQLGALSEPERSRVLGRQAWEWVQAEPARYAGLCLQRLRYFLLFDETNPKAANRLYRTSTAVWLVMAFIGLLMSRAQWRRLWPTYAIFGLVTLFHALVITSVRFRIPIEPISFVWAAAVLEPWASRLAGRGGLRIYHPGQCPRDPFQQGHILRGPHFPVRDKPVDDAPTRRRAG